MSRRRPPFRSVVVRTLAHQVQEPDEEVEEVQEDCQGGLDRVGQCSGLPHGAVQVEDDQTREHDDADPVERRQGATEGKAEECEQRHGEVADQQGHQAPHQPCSPTLQTLRNDRPDGPQYQHQKCRDREDLDDAGLSVMGHERPHQETEWTGNQGVSDEADDRVVLAPVRDHYADQADHEHATGEDPEGPLRLEVPVQRDPRHQRGEDDAGRREPSHGQGEQVAGHPVGVGVSLVPGIGQETHSVLPLAHSPWQG